MCSVSSSIQYPIFLEFTHHVKDSYWKLLYEDMAFGKFPSGSYVHKDFFCCIHKGKEFSIEFIDNPTPNQIFNLFTQIHSLLQTKIGIQSEKEKNKLRENLIQHQAQKDESQKRMIRDSSLTSFVIKQGEKNKLSVALMRRLFSLLIVGFMFKTILVKDVVFDGNEIENISGFSFLENKIRLTKNVSHIKKSYLQPESDKVETRVISSFWPKFINSLNILSSTA